MEFIGEDFHLVRAKLQSQTSTLPRRVRALVTWLSKWNLSEVPPLEPNTASLYEAL